MNRFSPVGAVVLGCLGPKGGIVQAHHFQGDRESVRAQAVAAALELGCGMVLVSYSSISAR